MTSFVEFKVEDSQLKSFHKDDCQWSRIKPLLAISVWNNDASGTLKIINDIGVPLQETSDKSSDSIPIKAGIKLSHFQWHPNSLVLAIAWESGDIGIYSLKSQKGKWKGADFKDFAQRTIIAMQWINDGMGLITVEMTGIITIWDYDDRLYQIKEKSNHQISDQVTDMVIVKSSNKNSIAYIGTTNGVVYQMVGATGTLNDVLTSDSSIKKILYYPRRNRVIIITESLLLCQYGVSAVNSELSEISKVKLSGYARPVSTDTILALMIDEIIGLIAVCIMGERVIRLWQLENGQNAAVIVAESSDSHWSGVTSVHFCNGIMAAGTSNNHVIVWKRGSGLDFNRVSQIHVKGGVKCVHVGDHNQIACITTTNDIYLIDEQNMCYAYQNKVIAVQTGAKLVKIKSIENDLIQELRMESPVKKIYVGTNGKIVGIKTSGLTQIDFYRYSDSINTMDSICSAAITETNNLMVINDDEVVWSFSLKTEDQNCTFILNSRPISTKVEETHHVDLLVNADAKDSMQIRVIAFDISREHLMTIISIGNKYYVYIFKVDGTKQIIKSGPTRIVVKNNLIWSKINNDGTMVAYIDNNSLIVVCTENGTFLNYDTEISGDVIGLCWAENEPRLLCFALGQSVHIILCSAKDSIIKLHEQIDTDKGLKLITMNIPYIYFLRGEEIVKQNLNELEGLTAGTVSIMLDFLTSKTFDLNQMIKKINQSGENNEKLWSNLARLSVKSRDINMGMYCAAKLQNARVVRDIKSELSETGDNNAACAILAMNLGMHNEAEEILKQSNNKSLLSKYYQGMNEWTKAIECVEKVNANSVYYNYAKYLEHEEGNVSEAIKYYEKSGTHVFEVPRMLFDVEGNTMLQDYCLTNSENSSETDRAYLIRWWGQYCESLGDINQALNAYKKSNDYYNLVRLLCYTGETEKAKYIINNYTSSSKEPNSTMDAAMLHLGRHLEASNPAESINYYLSCGAIKHAMRVCKNNELINELIKLTVNYGNQTEARELVDKYFDTNETDQEIDEKLLVQLYYKCGFLEKAIESALKTRTLAQLRDLLKDELTKVESDDSYNMEITDATIELAFDTLKIDSDMIDIVIDLILLQKNNQSALIERLIIDYNIEVNDKLVEKVEKVVKNQQQSQLMITLADLALQQGQFLISAKIYNNHGRRNDAIKALIRTENTDKIINYANIARDKDVYRIAANYLQTMNYSDDNVIGTFYRKAGAKQELERYNSRRKTDNYNS